MWMAPPERNTPPVMYSSPQPPKLTQSEESAVNVPPEMRSMPTDVGCPPKRHQLRIASVPPMRSTYP